MKKSGIMAPLLVLLVSLTLASCARDRRMDYSELNIRIGEINPNCVFDESALFYSNGVYYSFYSLNGENDMLLTMREDEEGKLDRITLTLNGEKKESLDVFSELSLILAEIFIPETDRSALSEKTGIASAAVFSETVNKYEQGFYSAVLFGSPDAPVFILTYG